MDFVDKYHRKEISAHQYHSRRQYILLIELLTNPDHLVKVKFARFLQLTPKLLPLLAHNSVADH